MEKKIKHKIKKGDLVLVISGNSRGKQGRIIEILVDSQRAIVEGINMVSRHTKPNASSPNGGIVKKEASIHMSNIKLIDPRSGKPTRVGRKLDANGKLVRYAKVTGEVIA